MRAQPREVLGVWLRGCVRPLRVRGRSAGQPRALLASSDLGFLLRRCGRVAVRDGEELAVVEAARLIGWRALQIVLGTPFLPGIDRLRELYPEMRLSGSTIVLPIGLGSAEEVLAACAAARLPVAATRIDYPAVPPTFG